MEVRGQLSGVGFSFHHVYPGDFLLQNICVHCEDVSLPKAPSDWVNKELNDQQVGRKGINRSSEQRVNYAKKKGGFSSETPGRQ